MLFLRPMDRHARIRETGEDLQYYILRWYDYVKDGKLQQGSKLAMRIRTIAKN